MPPILSKKVPTTVAPLCVILVLTVLLCGACGNRSWHGTVLERPLEVPVITGIDHRGEPFDSNTLAGRLQIVFFGYTFCPDYCPATMYEIADALAIQRAEIQAQIDVLFVSVDPERDNLERLSAYVDQFHPSIRGIRVQDQAVLDAVTSGYGVFVASGAQSNSDNVYLVDHTIRVYLLNREDAWRSPTVVIL